LSKQEVVRGARLWAFVNAEKQPEKASEILRVTQPAADVMLAEMWRKMPRPACAARVRRGRSRERRPGTRARRSSAKSGDSPDSA
jgi:hypothetical protein